MDIKGSRFEVSLGALGRRAAWLGVAVMAPFLATVLAPATAYAQLDASTLRGTVTDVDGHPLVGVAVEMEFKGESRQKVVKTATTDKKGAYIRVGLKPGPWTVTFAKEGFKPARLDTALSGGGISEIPEVRLKPSAGEATAPSAASAGSAAATGAAAGGPDDATAKELRAAYAKAIEAMRAGRNAEAEALLKGVVTAAPNLGLAHYNLAYLYAQRGDAAAAEPEYRKAIELDPAASDSYIGLAALLAGAHKEDEALKILMDAADRFAADGRFQFALGATAFNLGRTTEAEAAFRKAAELDPSNAESRFYLASLAVSRNDVKGAIEQLEKYLAAAAPNAPNRAAAQALLTTLKKAK